MTLHKPTRVIASCTFTPNCSLAVTRGKFAFRRGLSK